MLSMNVSNRGGTEVRHLSYWFFALQLLVLLSLLKQSAAQVGTSICGCQPAAYTFTFDFGLSCVDTDVEGPGINETACLTEIRGQDEVSDDELVVIAVQNIQIFELDQNNEVFAQTVRTGTFVDGSDFTYTSILSTMTDDLDPTTLPRGLQLVITGLNSNEDAVVQTYIIVYTNDCGIFPILTEGQTAGWTIFSDLGDPPTKLCPLVPSLAPTVDPATVTPTEAPATFAPIELGTPTQAPATDAPATDAPANEDTIAPSCPTGGKGGGKGKGGKSGKSGKGGDSSGGKSGRGGSSDGKAGMRGGKARKKERSNGKMERLGSKRRELATGRGDIDLCPEEGSSDTDNSRSSKGKGKGKAGPVKKSRRSSSKSMNMARSSKGKGSESSSSSSSSASSSSDSDSSGSRRM